MQLQNLRNKTKHVSFRQTQKQEQQTTQGYSHIWLWNTNYETYIMIWHTQENQTWEEKKRTEAHYLLAQKEAPIRKYELFKRKKNSQILVNIKAANFIIRNQNRSSNVFGFYFPFIIYQVKKHNMENVTPNFLLCLNFKIPRPKVSFVILERLLVCAKVVSKIG